MRITFAFLCLLISGSIAGQSIQREKITGEWICKMVTFAKDETLSDSASEQGRMILKMTRDAFTNSSFTFGQDGRFHIKFPTSVINEISKEFSFINGKTWALNSQHNRIDIGGRENLMAILVREEKGVTSFLLFETPIILTMKKIGP